MSERTKVERAIMRTIIKAQLGATSPKWKAFIGLSDAEQNEKLDANYATHADRLTPKVDEELIRREDARKAKAKLGEGIKITL